MLSAFGVEHGDEVSKGAVDAYRAFTAGAKAGRNIARGHQAVRLGGKTASAVGKHPGAAARGTQVGGLFARKVTSTGRTGGVNGLKGTRMRPKAFASPQPKPVATPTAPPAVAQVTTAQKKTPWGTYAMVGGGGAAAGAVGTNMYRRNS